MLYVLVLQEVLVRLQLHQPHDGVALLVQLGVVRGLYYNTIWHDII